MEIYKCKYYNDHQTCCSLMIDDLVPAAVSLDGKLGPYNDWGYLMDGPNSLYTYFKSNLLEKYPHIKGTFFLPLEAHLQIQNSPDSKVFIGKIDHEYISFLNRISNNFEFAFHGVKHTYYSEQSLKAEFGDIEESEINEIKEKILSFEKHSGIKFNGGKFPAYKFNRIALDFIEDMDFHWWALEASAINIANSTNEILSFNDRLVNIPTTLTGDIFNLHSGSWIKHHLKRLLIPSKNMKPEKLIALLYRKRIPIIIQEHFQNQYTSGRRQKPNIFDDIVSLQKIFFTLKGLDIWYASCSDMANYYETYVNTHTKRRNHNKFEISCKGQLTAVPVSFVADVPCLKEVATNLIYKGVRKGSQYIYNNLLMGVYMPCI